VERESGPGEAGEDDPLGGTVYEGQWSRGRPHGHGTATFPDGTKYIGYWVEGKRHTEDGQTSRCEFPNGHVYEGEFHADEIHGRGRLMSETGEVLDPGPWEHGVSQFTPYPINGTGRYEFPDGSYYDGDWQEGLFDGQGVFFFAGTGDTYTGGFRGGQFHGHGRYEFASGDKYEGGFEDGRPAGRGSYLWAREDQSYEGEWSEGVQHGHGRHIFSVAAGEESLIYEGGWSNGRMHGPGELRMGSFRVRSSWEHGKNGEVDMNSFPSLAAGAIHTFHFMGGTYTGTFKDRRPDGSGRMQYADGSVYEGGFRDFKFHGKGRLVHSSGCVYEGEWRGGAPHGQGVMRRVRPSARGEPQAL